MGKSSHKNLGELPAIVAMMQIYWLPQPPQQTRQTLTRASSDKRDKKTNTSIIKEKYCWQRHDEFACTLKNKQRNQ